MTKTFTTESGMTVLAVEVPEYYKRHDIYMRYIIFKVWNEKNGITDAQLADYSKLTKYLHNHNPDKEYKDIPIKLPEGNWTPIGIASELSEEQARPLVESHLKLLFTDYEDGFRINSFFKAVDSLDSRLRSLGMDTTKNILLIKKRLK